MDNAAKKRKADSEKGKKDSMQENADRKILICL